jgi:hypothetical protein
MSPSRMQQRAAEPISLPITGALGVLEGPWHSASPNLNAGCAFDAPGRDIGSVACTLWPLCVPGCAVGEVVAKAGGGLMDFTVFRS